MERADELAEPLGVLAVSLLPEISEDQMVELQGEDADLRPVIDWLQNGETPSPELLKQHSLETRNLWGQVPAVNLFRGSLCTKVV